jgi:hypothetical protein
LTRETKVWNELKELGATTDASAFTADGSREERCMSIARTVAGNTEDELIRDRSQTQEATHQNQRQTVNRMKIKQWMKMNQEQ